MTNNSDPKDLTKEALAARVQHLEQELALLKGQVRAGYSSTPPAAIAPADSIEWLLDTIKHLLTEHNSAGINYTLELVGQRLLFAGCNLWHWEQRGRHLKCIGAWQQPGLATLQEPVWLEQLLPADGTALAHLLMGHQVSFDASQLESSLLGALGIRHTTLVPIQRNHNTEAFIALHTVQADALSAGVLQQVHLIADLLFSVYDRQRLLRTLADRDTRFQYAMEASRDGLWDWNIETGQVYFSRSYLRMLGYKYDSLPGTLDTLRDYFLHPDDAEQVLTQYQAALTNQRPYMNLEYRMLHQNGSTLWIYSRTKFVEPDANGRARRCVGINADISDFIRSQQELLAAKTQADMANKAKGEFLARMSHEIRTPLNAIIGLGHLLHDTTLDDQQQSYLGSMTTAAESLLHIVNQVLDFSKIETGKIILENAHFDLDQVFEKLSRLFEISALHKAIDIVYDIKSNVPRFLRGDAARLSQVISHLITNALQYSTSSQVVVGVNNVKQNSQYVTLEFIITDFGVGMSQAQLTQLQNFLLKGSTSEPGAQGGFGLSICNHLVGLMDGRIYLNSKAGEGCKISFTARFEHSQLGAKSVHNRPHALANLRALIVDDNAIARNIIASTAHSIRLRADTSDSAEHALQKIRAANMEGNPYHLVLMDYKMPNIDGLQATRLIKADTSLNPTPLVLLISSYHKDEIFDENNHAAMVDGCVSKPVSESRLFDAIHQAIDSHHPFRKLLTVGDVHSEEDNLLLAGLRVLLAEDNLVNQQVARGILRKKGVAVTMVNNGREAVELLQQNSADFDMILMDLEMPELDGYQATQQIRAGKAYPTIPIVAVTAQALRGDRDRCLAAGMDAYITKPIMPDLLYRTLIDILRARLADKKI